MTEYSDPWRGRCIVVVGMTGVGKSTIGAHLAHKIGRRFVDLDRFIVEKTGRSIPDIFSEKGESGFRQLESRALVACLSGEAQNGTSDLVVSTGGGAVISAQNRRLLTGLGSAVDAESDSDMDSAPLVIWLQAGIEDLLRRVSGGVDRPLLAGDRRGVLERLMAERDPWYEEVADITHRTGGQAIGDVVNSLALLIGFKEKAVRGPDESLGGLGTSSEGSPNADKNRADSRFRVSSGVESGQSAPMIIENVDLGDNRSYPVLIGPGARHELASIIPEGVRRVAIVTQPGIEMPVDPGIDHQVFMIEDGEQAKRLEVVEELARSFARWGMTRNDAVVAVGGGVVTDLGGFVAATYHRGIRVIHVSTTLLGQIDAAIGGKCGVNLPEGKNLVGAFWQPSAVICDTDALSTLPTREFRSGMGELAKYHFLGGGNLDELALPERVAACVRIKADVVAADEREGGRRAILNYGHTLGHALEAASADKSAGSYGIRHGEGVAIGLVYAAEVARALGRIDDDRVAEHRRVLAAYDLSWSLPEGSDHADLVRRFALDKKAYDGVTFVLDGPDGVESVRVEDEQMLLDCLARMEA